MPGFDSLQNQKRGEANVARRQSMSDQQVKGGFLSNFFHKYVLDPRSGNQDRMINVTVAVTLAATPRSKEARHVPRTTCDNDCTISKRLYCVFLRISICTGPEREQTQRGKTHQIGGIKRA